MFLREEIAEVKVKSVFRGHGSLGAAPWFFFVFEMLERVKLVEAQVKSWSQGHGSLESAPLCQGKGSPDEKF